MLVILTYIIHTVYFYSLVLKSICIHSLPRASSYMIWFIKCYTRDNHFIWDLPSLLSFSHNVIPSQHSHTSLPHSTPTHHSHTPLPHITPTHHSMHWLWGYRDWTIYLSVTIVIQDLLQHIGIDNLLFNCSLIISHASFCYCYSSFTIIVRSLNTIHHHTAFTLPHNTPTHCGGQFNKRLEPRMWHLFKQSEWGGV